MHRYICAHHPVLGAKYRRIALLVLGVVFGVMSTGCSQPGSDSPRDQVAQSSAVVSDLSPTGEGPTPSEGSGYPAPAGYPAPSGYPAPAATSSVVFVTEPAPVLGVVVDTQMIVLHVEPGSAAAIAAVQIGDVLETLDGISIAASIAQVKARIREAQPNRPLSLKLRRGGQLVQVDIVPMPPRPQAGQATPTPVVDPNTYL